MNPLTTKLAALQRDHVAVTGQPFTNFYCPITHQDSKVPLCQAHLVNQAFRGSSKRTTVQRADVDSFFGSRFESDFVKLRHKGKHRLHKYLTDPTLARDLPPTFVLDGKVIPYYFPTGPTPAAFSEVALSITRRDRRLALKIDPAELMLRGKTGLTFGVAADLRLSALVSILKAAHLTLFDMLGYRYVYSPGGRFLGKDILGDFFLRNHGKPRKAILAAGWDHFSPYASMMRPLKVLPRGFRGTASDRRVLICRSSESVYWGVVVFIRTGTTMHAVLAPVFDTADAVGRFFEFLRRNGQYFEAVVGLFEGGAWKLAKNSAMFQWPAVDVPHNEQRGLTTA